MRRGLNRGSKNEVVPGVLCNVRELFTLIMPRFFLVFTLGLIASFSLPLYQLIHLAMGTDLYSHVLIIPFISVYLIWLRRTDLPAPSVPNRLLALVPLFMGLIALGVSWVTVDVGSSLTQEDILSGEIFAFVMFFLTGAIFFLGRNTIKTFVFPFVFLLFIVPLPSFLRIGIETFFQYASADVSYLFLKLSGTPIFRECLIFRLPGIDLEVAPECSGIRSSLVLFIVSLVASNLFLRSIWRRVLLVLFIIPLAVLRNSLRIFVIAQLCVQVGPEMIDSPLHKSGGPVFFALSLIPLFFLLFFLVKSEQKRSVTD
ncbi:MAG: VPDSG-CTERM-specific exosortase XrtC [Opitutaceae bacterium]|nr:VPDSG-CTERM-specific exosortase XrtC [Opitutaceae bacterium]